MNAHPSPAFTQRLALACAGTAVFSSIGLGFWDLIHPMFAGPRYTLTPGSPVQLWSYGVLQAFKPIGFLAGLYGFFLVATRQGGVLKIILALAAIGGVVYGVVWLMVAITGHDDALYIGNRALGSDGHSNGGALFLWLTPLALGIGAWFAQRVGRWQAAWVTLTGLLGARLFGMFPPGIALIVEGVLWLGVGVIIYRSAAA
jgi:hypothetical protein